MNFNIRNSVYNLNGETMLHASVNNDNTFAMVVSYSNLGELLMISYKTIEMKEVQIIEINENNTRT